MIRVMYCEEDEELILDFIDPQSGFTFKISSWCIFDENNQVIAPHDFDDEELLEMYYSEIKFQTASEDDLRKYLNCS